MKSPESEARGDSGQAGGALLTRAELAVALRVSLRTVDRMLACEEITPVRLRGTLVRFYLRDVVADLKGNLRKFGRRAACKVEG